MERDQVEGMMDGEKRTITLPASVTRVRETLEAEASVSDSEVILQALERFEAPLDDATRAARLDHIRRSIAESMSHPVRISDDQLGLILTTTFAEAALRRR